MWVKFPSDASHIVHTALVREILSTQGRTKTFHCPILLGWGRFLFAWVSDLSTTQYFLEVGTFKKMFVKSDNKRVHRISALPSGGENPSFPGIRKDTLCGLILQALTRIVNPVLKGCPPAYKPSNEPSGRNARKPLTARLAGIPFFFFRTL